MKENKKVFLISWILIALLAFTIPAIACVSGKDCSKWVNLVKSIDEEINLLHTQKYEIEQEISRLKRAVTYAEMDIRQLEGEIKRLLRLNEWWVQYKLKNCQSLDPVYNQYCINNVENQIRMNNDMIRKYRADIYDLTQKIAILNASIADKTIQLGKIQDKITFNRGLLTQARDAYRTCRADICP